MADARPGAQPETEELDADPEETEAETETEEGNEPEEVEAEAEEGTEPETEVEAEAEAETEDEPEPAPKPLSRAARRIQSLDERLKKTERELQEARRRPAAPDPNAIAEQQRREREDEEAVLLTSDSGKIAKFYADRATRQADQKFNGLAAHLLDTSDKTTFQTLVNSNPTYAQVAEEVEERLANARSQGMNPQRIAIAHLILGERVAKRAKPAATRQRKQAAVVNGRQVGRPGNARSDVTTGRRPSGDTQTKRATRLDESGLL